MRSWLYHLNIYRLSSYFGTIDVRSNAQLLSMTTQKIKLPHFLQKLHRSAHSDLYNHHLVETTTTTTTVSITEPTV